MKIAEIFESIHGEVNGHHQGRMCTFIRISGCNLKCPYCDTKQTQSFSYGTEMSLLQILKRVQSIPNNYICITGGEPLTNEQAILPLIKRLWENGYKISVETNGTIDIAPFFRYVESFIIDYKTGVPNYFACASNYLNLRNTDVIKFVVTEETLKQAITFYQSLEAYYKIKKEKPIIAFSPIISKNFSPKQLYTHLKMNRIDNIVLSLQIHKFADFN